MDDEVSKVLRNLRGEPPTAAKALSEPAKDALIQALGPRTVAAILKAKLELPANRIPFVFSSLDTQAVVDILANDFAAALDRAGIATTPAKLARVPSASETAALSRRQARLNPRELKPQIPDNNWKECKIYGLGTELNTGFSCYLFATCQNSPLPVKIRRTPRTYQLLICNKINHGPGENVGSFSPVGVSGGPAVSLNA